MLIIPLKAVNKGGQGWVFFTEHMQERSDIEVWVRQ